MCRPTSLSALESSALRRSAMFRASFSETMVRRVFCWPARRPGPNGVPLPRPVRRSPAHGGVRSRWAPCISRCVHRGARSRSAPFSSRCVRRGVCSVLASRPTLAHRGAVLGLKGAQSAHPGSGPKLSRRLFAHPGSGQPSSPRPFVPCGAAQTPCNARYWPHGTVRCWSSDRTPIRRSTCLQRLLRCCGGSTCTSARPATSRPCGSSSARPDRVSALAARP